MERLISADRLLKWIRKAEEVLATDKICCSNMIWMVEQSPTVDAEPVRHGKWILERKPDGTPRCLHCSVCDDDFRYIDITTAYNYCPHCGAKMLTERVFDRDEH